MYASQAGEWQVRQRCGGGGERSPAGCLPSRPVLSLPVSPVLCRYRGPGGGSRGALARTSQRSVLPAALLSVAVLSGSGSE